MNKDPFYKGPYHDPMETLAIAIGGVTFNAFVWCAALGLLW